MERMGLVARIEEELERVISLGRLTKNGFLPSEQVLARRYGVSRATAREALLRLAVRGLVVQHPGRKSRAVPLDEAVTLENLSVALHAEGPAHPERRRLLEGFFELKREMTVELLAACCEYASEADLSQLMDVCFVLAESAHWEEGSVWAKREFELLRRAALAANRPGHFLLIQSLERSFWAMAGRVLPHLDCEAISRWALCAFHALGERDAQGLRRELPALLQAGDTPLFGGLASPRWEDDTLVDLHTSAERGPEGNSESERGKLPGAVCPNRSACPTGSREALPGGLPPSEATQGQLPVADRPNRSACHTGSCQAPPGGTPQWEAPQGQLPDAFGLNLSDKQTGSCQVPQARGSPTESAPGELPDAVGPNLSACQTGLCQALPTRDFWPEPPSTRAGGCSGRVALGAGVASVIEGAWRAHTWSPVPWGRRPQLPSIFMSEGLESGGRTGSGPGGGPQALPVFVSSWDAASHGLRPSDGEQPARLSEP